MSTNQALLEDIERVKGFSLLLNPKLIEIENLDVYIALTLRKILNYCNLTTLPDELVEITAEILIDLIKVGNSKYGEEQGQVKSIVEGDTTVTFDFTGVNEYKKHLDMFLKDYYLQLGPFRIVRW